MSANTFTLNFVVASGAGRVVDRSGNTITAINGIQGDVIYCLAVPNAGYHVATPTWELVGVGTYTTNPIDTVFDGYGTFQVNVFFEADTVETWTVNISVSPTGAGFTTPAGPLSGNVGGPIYVEATANSGYVFSKWTLNGADYSTNSILDGVIGTAGTYALVAVFAPTGGGGDTFGHNVVGATPWNTGDLAIHACKFTSPVDAGILTKITAYVAQNVAGALGRAVLFSDSGGSPDAVLAVGASDITLPASPAWVDFPISYALSPNTVYWLAIMSSASMRMWYDAGSANQFSWDNHYTYPTPAFPYDNFQPWQMSIYATYEPTGVPDWTLTISAGAGGSVSPASVSGMLNDPTGPITATANVNYAFAYWLYDGARFTGDTTNPIDLTIGVAGNHALQAVFIYSGTDVWDWKDEFTDKNARWNWDAGQGAQSKTLETVDGFSVADLRITAAGSASAVSDNALPLVAHTFVTAGKTIIVEGRMRFNFNTESPYVGTVGFGWWDSAAKLIWFLGCSPPSQAEFRGYRAIVASQFTSPSGYSLNQPLSADIVQWHTYRIEISPSGVVFKIDGVVVGQTSSYPTGEMELIIWNDNQYLQNYGGAGLLDVVVDQDMYIDYIAYRETTEAPTTWTLALSASPTAGGTVSATATSGNVGTPTTVTASPTANYTFSQWVYDGGVLPNTSPSLSLTPTVGPHTLVAVFAPISSQFTLTVTSNLDSLGGVPVTVEAV